ncbi:flavodoxin domain-containing protein, partial [candidate division WOR-3 bacterium]|nr:flavodoxin domain-containing protein [candidate division WOR-3 bacterium]
MSRILIIYYSRTGNTEKMAELVSEGVKKESVEVVCKKVDEVTVEELVD